MTDALIERDLTAVDEALASGVATHGDPLARELQELSLALRTDAPRPEPRFAEELERRVEAGFPREPGAMRRARRKPLVSRRFALSGAAGAATLLLVGAVWLASRPDSVTNMSKEGPSLDGGAAGGGEVEKGASASPGAALTFPNDRLQAETGAPTSGRYFVPEQPNRKIERSYSLDLDVPLDDMARVADQVTAVTYRHGGFVLNSSVNSGREEGGGDFSLRIPSDRLRPALRDLAGLAPVIRQSQEGRDVTRQHVTAKDRLQAARTERRSLLRRLAEAETDESAEAIRRRLDLVAGEINGLRTQLRDLRLRTDYAIVTVSLLVAGHHDNGGVGGSFDDAVDDAGSLLVGFAGVLIRVLALAIPLGLISLGAWLAARAARRRRRESALA
jgi:hypothetical protein